MTNKCDSKVDEVEGLAKLLGVEQMKLTGAETRSVAPPPATIMPAAIFKEVSFCAVLFSGLICLLQM